MPRRQGRGEPVDRVAAVCYRSADGAVQFLLVRTKGGEHWTFPKGHIEEGEMPWQAAQREALEEAGVRGGIETEPFTVFPHEQRASDGRPMQLRVAAYLLRVESESDTAESRREPTWFSPDQTREKLAEKRGLRFQQAYRQVIDEACQRLVCERTADRPEER